MINPNDLSEHFSLDADLIRRDMDACLAMAQYHREMQGQKASNAEFAATLLRRAAAHSLLVVEDREKRASMFRDAAYAYWNLDMPYGHMLFVLGETSRFDRTPNDSFFSANLEDQEESLPGILQSIYPLIASINPDFSQNSNWNHDVAWERLQKYRQTRMGTLGIPVGIYLDLYDALSPHGFSIPSEQSNDPPGYQPAVYRILDLYDVALERAQQNQFNWKRLLMPFHPAEIDIISLLVSAHKAVVARRRDISIMELIEIRLQSEKTKLILRAILSDYLNE